MGTVLLPLPFLLFTLSAHDMGLGLLELTYHELHLYRIYEFNPIHEYGIIGSLEKSCYQDIWVCCEFRMSWISTTGCSILGLTIQSYTINLSLYRWSLSIDLWFPELLYMHLTKENYFLLSCKLTDFGFCIFDYQMILDLHASLVDNNGCCCSLNLVWFCW